MKIADVLEDNEKGISLEFFPPKTDEAAGQLMGVVEELRELTPLYASVTYGAGGTTQDRTKDTLFKLREETDLTLMSHLTCVGASRESLDALLGQYREHGIDNILALRGDPPHDMYEFDRDAGDFTCARDLVAFIKGYDYFSIAVAVYPEGHPEAASLDADLDYTKTKVDAGADFAITQMFFDNSYFYRFRDRAGQKGITLPVFPGIMPITDIARIKKFADFCKATIPADVERTLAEVQDQPGEMFKRGVELCTRQCQDLIDNGVRYLHFYTLNQSRAVREVVKGLSL